MTQKNARKKIYVNRDIQGKILQRLTKYWVLYHLGLWCSLFLIKFVEHSLVAVPGDAEASLGAYCIKFERENWGVMILPIILFPAIWLDMLRLTHQVAGPLVRFRNVLRQLAAGETVEKIELREGDLLGEFQNAFNEFLACKLLKQKRSGLSATPSNSCDQEELILNDVAAIGDVFHPSAPQPSTVVNH